LSGIGYGVYRSCTTVCDEIFNILLVYKPTVLLADCTQNIHIFNVFGRLIMDPLKMLFGPMELKLTRFYYIHRGLRGHAVAQWLRHCATNQKVAGLIPDGAIGIF
jgi:hypothetical protein